MAKTETAYVGRDGNVYVFNGLTPEAVAKLSDCARVIGPAPALKPDEWLDADGKIIPRPKSAAEAARDQARADLAALRAKVDKDGALADADIKTAVLALLRLGT